LHRYDTPPPEYEDRGMWIGYLVEFPDYKTQGETFEDSKKHLEDLYKDLTSGKIPAVRRVAELEI